MMNLADGIAVTAILVSFFTLNKTNSMAKKIATKSLNIKFFEEIFFEHIIIEFPNALSKIQHDELRLAENCEAVEAIIFIIIDRSKFYNYFDTPFYNKVKVNLINLDTTLVRLPLNISNIDVLSKYRQDVISLSNKFYNDLKTYYSKI